MTIGDLPKDYMGYIDAPTIVYEISQAMLFFIFSVILAPITFAVAYECTNYIFMTLAAVWCILSVCCFFRHCYLLRKAYVINKLYHIEMGKEIARLRANNKAYTEKELIELGKADAFESECE